MLHIRWMVIFGSHNIKKISLENFDFGAGQGEKLPGKLWAGPFTKPLLVVTVISRLWRGLWSALSKGRDCKKRPFCILVGI